MGWCFLQKGRNLSSIGQIKWKNLQPFFVHKMLWTVPKKASIIEMELWLQCLTSLYLYILIYLLLYLAAWHLSHPIKSLHRSHQQRHSWCTSNHQARCCKYERRHFGPMSNGLFGFEAKGAKTRKDKPVRVRRLFLLDNSEAKRKPHQIYPNTLSSSFSAAENKSVSNMFLELQDLPDLLSDMIAVVQIAEVKPKGNARAPCRSRATKTINETKKKVDMKRLVPESNLKKDTQSFEKPTESRSFLCRKNGFTMQIEHIILDVIWSSLARMTSAFWCSRVQSLCQMCECSACQGDINTTACAHQLQGNGQSSH